MNKVFFEDKEIGYYERFLKELTITDPKIIAKVKEMKDYKCMLGKEFNLDNEITVTLDPKSATLQTLENLIAKLK